MSGLSVFFWLRGQDACRLIALQAGIFVERGVDGRGDLRLIGGLLVGLLPTSPRESRFSIAYSPPY
jgi:hypothetical protein